MFWSGLQLRLPLLSATALVDTVSDQDLERMHSRLAKRRLALERPYDLPRRCRQRRQQSDGSHLREVADERRHRHALAAVVEQRLPDPRRVQELRRDAFTRELMVVDESDDLTRAVGALCSLECPDSPERVALRQGARLVPALDGPAEERVDGLVLRLRVRESQYIAVRPPVARLILDEPVCENPPGAARGTTERRRCRVPRPQPPSEPTASASAKRCVPVLQTR